MTNPPESQFDRLWNEYSQVFHEFDDLTLARWLSQTLGQLQGRVWRMSHPLAGAFRLAALVGHDRQIWQKRLATIPFAYTPSPCCGGPLLPVFTRDVMEDGLTCVHCNNTAVSAEDIPSEILEDIRQWSADYEAAHSVAHWEDRRRKTAGNYDALFEEAAKSAERLLQTAGKELMPRLLAFYPALIWEDNDECLEVRPDDLTL